MERVQKYLVLKRDDIEKFLNDKSKAQLDGICAHIAQCREYYGKPDNSYVVVNEDEVYAESVWRMIEANQG